MALMMLHGAGPCWAQAPAPHRSVLILYSSGYDSATLQHLDTALNEGHRTGSPAPLDIYSAFTGLDRFDAGPA